MPHKFNIKNLEFPQVEERDAGFRLQACKSGHVNFPSTDFDIRPRSLPPGSFSFPYHSHRQAEELFLVLEGEMTVRTPEGLQIAKAGDVWFFEKGATGAHQFFNHTTLPCVYLDLRTTPPVDVCDYPDSGKIQVIPYGEIFESSTAVGYFEGEENPMAHWPERQSHDPE